MCGQVEGFNYDVITKDIDVNDISTNITVNASFRSTLPSKKKPLYFVAFYGDARPFDREIDVSWLLIYLTITFKKIQQLWVIYSKKTVVVKYINFGFTSLNCQAVILWQCSAKKTTPDLTDNCRKATKMSNEETVRYVLCAE